MYLRSAALLALIGIVVPAFAEEMRPDEARRFVAGKLFSYSCFEGTTGAGRIYSDGSVAGTIQIGGSGPVRHVTLPSGTIRIGSESICASVRGGPFEPCFNVVKTDPASFRGSLSGLGFAYCNFTRRNARSLVMHANADADDDVATGSIAAPMRIHAPRPIHSAVILRKSQD
jgi:hypothetical protein